MTNTNHMQHTLKTNGSETSRKSSKRKDVRSGKMNNPKKAKANSQDDVVTYKEHDPDEFRYISQKKWPATDQHSKENKKDKSNLKDVPSQDT